MGGVTNAIPFTRIAECGENQSGQRFLDSSDPRLIRHVASCDAAGGGIKPLPAGKDKKLSREFEGRTLIGAAGAVPSLLDSITNNRHSPEPRYYARPVGRGKYCGRWSIRGRNPETGRTIIRRVNCGSWSCSYCGPRKAKLARYAIRRIAEELALRYFLTLTLDPSKLEHREDAVRYIRTVFNKFREYLRREYGEPPNYICILEFTQKGMPHLHVLLDRYIDQKWISSSWDGLGGGKIVFIKQVTIRRVARYLSKYLTKELILSAPKRARRITTARAIRLFPKFQSGIFWEFFRESIWHVLEGLRASEFGSQLNLFRVLLMHFDEEHYLNALELAETG